MQPHFDFPNQSSLEDSRLQCVQLKKINAKEYYLLLHRWDDWSSHPCSTFSILPNGTFVEGSAQNKLYPRKYIQKKQIPIFKSKSAITLSELQVEPGYIMDNQQVLANGVTYLKDFRNVTFKTAERSSLRLRSSMFSSGHLMLSLDIYPPLHSYFFNVFCEDVNCQTFTWLISQFHFNFIHNV